MKRMRLACDFCLKTQDQVTSMIKGPGDLAICDECVNLCVDVLKEQAVAVDSATTELNLKE